MFREFKECFSNAKKSCQIKIQNFDGDGARDLSQGGQLAIPSAISQSDNLIALYKISLYLIKAFINLPK